MNRKVHVRFRETAGLRCPAPLNYLHAYETLAEARASISRYIEFYSATRPHYSLKANTPDQVYCNRLPVPLAA